jgi:trehalose 6-phosphate synthase
MGKSSRQKHQYEYISGDRGSPTDGDDGLIVISNRQPYRHSESGDGIEVDRPRGGLTAGLDAVMREVNGRWIAWGDGGADRAAVDEDGCVAVPPDSDGEGYTLERVWLSDRQVEGYYYGFSNRVLWPLCHAALTRVRYDPDYWDHYRTVNRQFADAVAERIDGPTLAWFQDYHLALAPRMVAAEADDAVLAQFWHVPWPSRNVFRAAPHSRELLEGLLENDLLGFHIPRYCANFLRCADALLDGATVDWESGRVFYRDAPTTVASFPMGVDADRIGRLAAAPDADAAWSRLNDEHGLWDVAVAVGVDRLDYTKGIPERLRALEYLWETHPEWRGRLTYVQVGTESRSQIPAYRELQETVEDRIDRINDRFETDEWTPVVYTTEMIPDRQLYGLYRRADLGVVTPLRDGMNLVAQEYVAAQTDHDGALVISDQAGVEGLFDGEAITVSPHETDAVAAAVRRGLELPPGERRRRMRSLRETVSDNDLSSWLDGVFATVDDLAPDAPL